MKSAIIIEKSFEEIFAYVEDGTKTSRYIYGEFNLEPVLTPDSQDGRYTLGSYLMGHACFFGKNVIKLPYRVYARQRNRMVFLKTEGGKFYSEVRWQLDPLEENKTQVSLEVTLEPRGRMAGLFEKLMDPYIKPAVTKYLEKALLRLKLLLEEPSPVLP